MKSIRKKVNNCFYLLDAEYKEKIFREKENT